MKVIVMVWGDNGSVEASWKKERKPEVVVEYFGNIEINEEKLLQALDTAKEAIK